MSPELLAEQPYDAVKSDIFAVGIVLFIFVMGYPPFLTARHSDPRYLMYIRERSQFWRNHQRRVQRELDPNLMALFEGMTHPDPQNRFGFAEIRASAWLAALPSPEQALDEMSAAHQKCREAIELERQEEEGEAEGEAEMAVETRSGAFSTPRLFEKVIIKDESEVPQSCFLIRSQNIVAALEEVKRRAEEGDMVFEERKGQALVRFWRSDNDTQARFKVTRVKDSLYAVKLIKERGDYCDVMRMKELLARIFNTLV